jgi:drug/metabolite transporter (DMT)-like permease
MSGAADAAAADPRSRFGWWPHALLTAMGIAWGATVSLTTIVMQAGHGPLTASLLSLGIGFLCLSLVLVVRRIRPPAGLRHIEFYLFCGLLCTALPNLLAFAAAAHLQAGVRSILFALVPMMTLAFMAALGRERAGLRRLCGLLLGLASVLVLLTPGATAVLPTQYPWIAVTIATVACYAIQNVYIDMRRPADLDPIAALWGTVVVAIIATAAVLWWTGPESEVRWGLGRVELALVLMSVLNIACYVGYIVLIGKAGPVFASQVSYLTPPLGIAWGVAILGESVPAIVFVSVAMALAGIALVRPRQGKIG